MKKEFRILKLKPTQIAIGMLEVDEKVRRYKKMGRAKTKKDAKEHPGTVIIGPDGSHFLIDGHHRARALWLMGFQKMTIEIKEDFRSSHLSYKSFWKKMNIKKWAHPHDQFGEGPRDPLYLPKDIRGVADAPYRSLAWLVREAGGFEKSKHWLTDFTWANYFRKKKIFQNDFDLDYKKATQKALKLAKSPAAKKLPGWTGPG